MDKDVTTRNRGFAVEAAVEKMLEQSGLRIVERNYRCKPGEIDIVAMETARDKTQILVFVEVRLRSHGGFGSGFDSVDYRKQKNLKCHLYMINVIIYARKLKIATLTSVEFLYT